MVNVWLLILPAKTEPSIRILLG